MTEETVQPDGDVTVEPAPHDPSLDHDNQDDANKGATIGGIGGAVTGAVVGSMAGPLGTLAGAVIGGIVAAASSKAAVDAIDKFEHNHATHTHDSGAAAHPIEPETVPESPVVSMKDLD